MSDSDTKTDVRLVGLLAEFDGPDALVDAAGRFRQAGYRRLEAFSPFPIHALDTALAIGRSRLPWIVLLAGIAGGAAALGGQWWTNAVDYPYIISGKPLFSLPANIPVTFEVIILCAAFAAFLGMLMLAGLPRLANPLHRSKHFLKATTDGFFLLIDAEDKRFSREDTAAALRDAGGTSVTEIEDEVKRARIPRPVFAVLAILAALALVPPLMIARARATVSSQPPLRSFKDMDFQPKFKAQTQTSLFPDGRAMRPPVPGTVARGELRESDSFYRGLQSTAPSQQLTSLDRSTGSAAGPGDNSSLQSEEPTEYDPQWTTRFPRSEEHTSELQSP